ncbi:MAG: asparagine synthase (glutamine-hydrolyzing) [Planctomycetota bacterium]
MCGIAGVRFRDSSRGRVPVALERMGGALRRRGPDDEGVALFSRDGGVSDGESLAVDSEIDWELGFVHRRLSIQDTSNAGHQPMSTHDGRYWIVFNGEVYNFRELRRELESEGVEFRSRGDTEVVLQALVRWGEGALRRFNGMFALALWDRVERSLFCARDRLGIKPFYFTETSDGAFLFASDIKTLIASGLYTPEIDREALYYGLSFGVAPRPTTAFRGVRALRPGHWLRLGPQGQESSRYWSLPLGTCDENMSERDAVAELEERLTQSVRRRLVSDVEVASFLSGGIDSTTVSALAAKELPTLRAFTLAYEAPGEGETEQARANANHFGVEHVVRELDPWSILDATSETVLCSEEPHYSLGLNYQVCELVADHAIKVVLSGLGGDELFAGYPYYRQAQSPLQRIRSQHLWRLVAKVSPKRRRLAAMAQEGAWVDKHSRALGILGDAEKARLFGDPCLRDLSTPRHLRELYVPDGAEFSSVIEAFSFMDLANYVGNHHLYRLDQFSMHFSLEARVPMLDHELVEFAFRVPSRWKITNGEQKYCLRRVAEKYIHPSSLSMSKRGFSIPLERWLRGPLQTTLNEKIERLAGRDVFRGDELRRWQVEFERGRRSAWSMWALVSVENWIEAFFDRSLEFRSDRELVSVRRKG